MATESLVVELSASTKKLDAALAKTDKGLNNLDKQTRKNDTSLNKLTKTAGAVGGALAITATAGLALATALTAVVLKSASSQRELSLLSKQAKLSTEDFEALAFATTQYGINAEQIADISKDLADKLGEFGKVGTGVFQDYADIIGLTKDQAKLAAIEFENMSSDQVIGKMVSEMEKAGASGNEMTFVLESMGNNLSRLIPLFANGSKELKTLTSTFASATEQIKLSNEEIKGLQGAATSFDLLNKSLSQSGKLISAQLAPALDEFFKGVIDVVPTATQSIVNFINTFRDAAEIENIKSIESELDSLTESLDKWNKKQLEAIELGAIPGAGVSGGIQSSKYAILGEEIEKATKRSEELNAQLKILEEKKLADAERLKGGSITSTFSGSGTGGTADEIQAIADRFKTEEELLLQKLNNELVIIGDNDELKIELKRQYYEDLKALEDSYNDSAMEQGSQLRGLFESNQKDQVSVAEDASNDKEKAEASFTNAAIGLGAKLFEDNKAIRYGMAVADTAAGVMKAFATSTTVYDGYVNAAAVALNGVKQLAAIDSATVGGGSSTEVSGTTQSTEIESSELTVENTDASGESQAQIITLQIESDDDDLAVALNGILGKAKVNGVIS